MEFSQDGSVIRVRFKGVLTFHDDALAESLIQQLDTALARGITEVRFELADVDALDSHWLGAFVRALRRIRAAGAELRLVRPQPAIRRLITVVELDRLLEVTD